ncbi:MAG TPA: hypothetical protein VFI22_15370 [Thermomicrobiales bacterium]|nr:hypothetical protein [Thermomicrobiales bacterium]
MQHGNGDGKKWLLVIGGVIVGWWLLCSIFTAGWWLVGSTVADGPGGGFADHGHFHGGMPMHGPVVYHTLGFPPLLLIAGIVLLVMGIRRGWFDGLFGPGPGGPGGPGGQIPPQAGQASRPGWGPPWNQNRQQQLFDEWHRQAHAAENQGGVTPPPAPTAPEQPGEGGAPVSQPGPWPMV